LADRFQDNQAYLEAMLEGYSGLLALGESKTRSCAPGARYAI